MIPFSRTVLSLLLLLLFSFPRFGLAEETGYEIKIGVLDNTSCVKGVMEKWQATATYLTSAVEGHAFTIVPLAFDKIHGAVEQGEVDFVLTNPSIYISLESLYGANRISTLKTRYYDAVTTSFAGVIFCRADRQDITELKDLKKKKVMAVDEKSFAGWQAGWRHLKQNGINPRKDFTSLTFGGSQNAVIWAVQDGNADAGIIRTGILENLGHHGQINPADFRVLDQQQDDNLPFVRTTRLYPEWAFAKVKHTPDELAQQVMISLLKISPDNVAALIAHSAGWTIPLNYQPVHECLKELKIGPYASLGKISPTDIARIYWPWLVVTLLLLLLGFSATLYFQKMSNKLSRAMDDVEHELQERKAVEDILNSFKLTLDQIEDCVFMFAPDTLKFFYANQGAIDQVGYSEEELLAMTAFDIKPDFNEESFRQLIQPLLDGEKTSLFYETTQWHKNGYALPVEIRLQYIIPPKGQGRFVAIVRDITTRKEEEKKKEKMQGRLLQSQKLESVGQLAAGIAHEINTPTQYVGTNIDFLDEAFHDIDELIGKYQELLAAAKEGNITAEMLANIEEAAEEADWEYLTDEIPSAISQSGEGLKRISKIVQAMKEFSHPGGSEKTPVDLNKIIKNTATVATNEWKYAADLKLDLSPELPSVSCFADEMGQVFLNIIVNAAHAIANKFGENPDNEKGLIKISSRQNGDFVEVQIADNGMGIHDIIKDKIFDPFFTTKEVGKGTGQGLTIAHDVVAGKHGGSITLESDLGVGTTFTIRLPLT